MVPSPKPWYARRRYWTVALLAVFAYFGLIPMPLRISPETTGITEPILPDGNVDYFDAFEKSYIHKLSPPEENGERLLIAALGPRVFEQHALATTVPWEEMPTHEHAKRWFAKQWVPLCEHMSIDPYTKPQYLDNPDFFSGEGCCGDRTPATWDCTLLKNITLLPIDRNIAGKRVTKFLQTAGQISIEEQEKIHAETKRQVKSVWSVFRVPLIRTRSQLIADQVLAKCFYTGDAAQKALDRTNTRFDLLRVATALERYKAANGDYPETLDELIPTYLDGVLIDLFADGKPLTYKFAPDAETAFLLYSYGGNETDGGDARDIVLRMGKTTPQNP